MEELLNEEDEKEQDRLTEIWKSNKIEELNFVGIVVRAALHYQRPIQHLTNYLNRARFWLASLRPPGPGQICWRAAPKHPGQCALAGSVVSTSRSQR